MTDFTRTRGFFHLPEGVIYLDGNSLGPLPRSAEERLRQCLRAEWGEMLVTGWNRAGWMDLSRQTGDRIAPLIGAAPGHVITGDTLSLKLYQALAAALELNPGRRVVLSDSGNFPSDLYIARGLLESLGGDYQLRIVKPDEIEENIGEYVAVLMLTEVDYRSGRKHDMAALSRLARRQGVITIWDLAHSAGAFPVDLAGCGVDFAVGCSYKYLNGGPGAPGFIYVAPEHAARVRNPLSGWLGHAAPFDFDLDYRPAPGIGRMRVGTPPVLALKVLEAALEVWDGVEMNALRSASVALSELFIREVERRCPALTLASPRDPEMRGSQVSFRFAEGHAAMQALVARGVIGDFRAPDIMRFGFTPLYLGTGEVMAAVAAIEEVIANRLWDAPEYRQRGVVT